MSADDQGGAGRREVAYRLFAAEFDDADFSYSQSDEERAPNYVVTPTGARVNRLFLVGVLTEVEQAGEDILRARVVDPTGAFVVYAGQYQPDAQAFFERADPPAFVAVTGKARTFQPDDADVTYTSVRPENVNEVTAETRDRWVVGTARQTLDRVATTARALGREERGDDLRRALEAEGVDVGLAAGIPLAIDHYGTSAAYLDAVRTLATQAAEVVAGDRDEVDSLVTDPDAPGDADLAALANTDVSGAVGGETDAPPAADDAGDADVGAAAAGSTDGASAGPSADPASDTTADASTDAASEGSAESAADTATDDPTEAEQPSATAETVPTDEVGTGPAAASLEDAETDDAAGTEAGPTSEPAEPAEADETAGPDATETSVADADGGGEPDVGVDAGADAGGDIGDFDPGEFELDEDEREAIEEEYGTDFQTGTEVEEPGTADIETPDPEETEAEAGATAAESTETDGSVGSAESAESAEPAEPGASAGAAEPTVDDAEASGADASASESDAEAASGGDAEGESEPAADVDVDTAVMDAMREHDDGDGAPEDAIVETVTDRLGVGEEEVSEAIQDALMGGQCYEPDDGVYKPI